MNKYKRTAPAAPIHSVATTIAQKLTAAFPHYAFKADMYRVVFRKYAGFMRRNQSPWKELLHIEVKR